jgi:hypothetical protein
MMDTAVMGRRERADAPNLRRVLALDAATCVGMGLLLLAATAPLATLLALPSALLFWAGLLLFPSAALMAAAAARPLPALVWTVIIGNAAWVLASLGVLGVLAPNAFGIAFVLGQAAVVLVLMVLERRGLAAA